MTPEQMQAHILTLTEITKGLDQDAHDQQILRKHDAQLIRVMSADVSELRLDVKAIKETQGDHGKKLDEILALLQAKK